MLAFFFFWIAAESLASATSGAGKECEELGMEKESTPEGILLVDKQPGWTSHDVVGKLRRALGVKKIGHAGTLDPFATGLLIILVGKKYTKMSEWLTGQDKTYEATVTLGSSTTTDDLEGDILETGESSGIQADQIQEALKSFLGKQKQAPPQFSAISVGGVRAYKHARKGRAMNLGFRDVEVFEIGNIEIKMPEIKFSIRVSKGTYIRAIARDMGRKLGVPAHLSALRRTRSGDYKLENAVVVSKETTISSVNPKLVLI